MNEKKADWHIFTGEGKGKTDWKLPDPPSWRRMGVNRNKRKGETFQVKKEEIELVNAALYLRRPLLVTGKPGTGKSSLAYKVASELNLGEVLSWPITTRTTLQDGLYKYDAIGRLQEVKWQQETEDTLIADKRQALLKNIEKYITLGPLGTALLPSDKPRVLLIDEIDKSDIDLPNDLLNLFEEGRFEIPELERIKADLPIANLRTAYTDSNEVTGKDMTYPVENGLISCTSFPFVILTSNGERDFPPPFLRRCLRLDMKPPNKDDLIKIVEVHLGETLPKDKNGNLQQDLDQLFNDFETNRDNGTLATDQLLNAMYLVKRGKISTKENLIKHILRDLGSFDDESVE